jgi:outer membrane immunogenic protein
MAALGGLKMRRQMKWILSAVALLGIAATTGATAADLPVKAPRAAPVPLYNWTGCYVGGNVGGGWTRTDTTRVLIDPGISAPLDYGRENDSGFIGGGQVGCDFQTTNWVFGIEGTFDFGSVKSTHNVVNLPGFTESNNMQQIYTATGRIGYLWTPQLLTYGRVGIAYFNNKNQLFFPGGGVFESARFTDPGILAGGGIEYMFTPNWSVFAEANYIWTEDDAAHDYVTPAGVPSEVINDRQRIITALVGINYKFHWDNGPVVAKY